MLDRMAEIDIPRGHAADCRSWAGIPPGPQLSGALAGIDLNRLSGFDCVLVLKARYRQLNHDRAALMSATVEVGLCGPASEDHTRMSELPPGELAGWGPIHAELARDLATLMAGGQWRFAITD
jgi:hypothetical protein